MTDITETYPTTSQPASPNEKQGSALFTAARFLIEDMASTLLFAGLFAVTHNAYVATGVAVAAGIGQIGWRLTRRSPVDALQWMSLGLVVVFGAASLLTHDPRFIMIKPTLIYIVVGGAMLKRGWMSRYMPPEVRQWAPGLPEVFGYIWAATMLATALINAALVAHGDMKLWTLWLAIFPAASKVVLFATQYLVTRAIVIRRIRAA